MPPKDPRLDEAAAWVIAGHGTAAEAAKRFGLLLHSIRTRVQRERKSPPPPPLPPPPPRAPPAASEAPSTRASRLRDRIATLEDDMLLLRSRSPSGLPAAHAVARK